MTTPSNRSPERGGTVAGFASSATPDQAGIALAPRLARLIVAVVFCCYALVGFVRVLYLPVSPLQIVESLGYMVAMLVLQLFYFSWRPSRRHSLRGYAALLVQACLAYLPIFQFKQAWVGIPGFLAGGVLLVLPPVVAWIAFGLVVASMAVIQTVFGGPVVNTIYVTAVTVITGLVVYGLSRLALLVSALHAARAELAELAVTQERLRFARDLHDLLGYSLSAITLKSELTSRLLLKQPAQARDELTQILDIARQALSDVRAVASGYRELSLEDESRSVRSVLTAADVDVQMDVDYRTLPSQVSTVLATVLREGVTNILRHSKAEHCRITVRQVRNGDVEIDITNDGVAPSIVQPDRDRDRGPGNGTRNLANRVTALGGDLTAGPDGNGGYRLHATIPLTWAAQHQVPQQQSPVEQPASNLA